MYTHKLSRKEFFFFVGYSIYFCSLLLTYSMYEYNPIISNINKIFRYFIAFFFLMLSIWFGGPVKKTPFFWLILLLIFQAYNFFFCSDKSVIMLMLIIFSAVHIDFEKIMRVSFVLSVFMMLFIILSSLFGIIENRLYIQEAGTRVRYSLGYGYANMSSKFFVSITLMYLYLKKENIKIRNIVILFLLNYVLYVLTDTRMSFILSTIILLGALVLKDIEKHKCIKKLLYFITPYCAIICAVFTYFGTLMYSHYRILDILNTLINQRFRLGLEALRNYGVSLLGKNIPDFVGPKEKYDNPALIYNYVDSSYVQLLIKNGLIFMVIVFILFWLLGKKVVKEQDNYMLFMVIVISIHSIIEPGLLRLSYYPFLIYFSQFFLNVGIERSLLYQYDKFKKLHKKTS